MVKENLEEENMSKNDYSLIPSAKIGILTVIKAIKVQNGYHWLCRCDCGREVKYLASEVKSYRRNCGCNTSKNFKKLKFGQYAANRIISSYKAKAKLKNLAFNLTEEECILFFKSNCYYCGSKPSNCSKSKTGNFEYNGIDRVNNDKGYTQDNCVSCCNMCNKAKRHLKQFDFLDWIDKVHKNQKEYYIYIQDFTNANNIQELIK